MYLSKIKIIKSFVLELFKKNVFVQELELVA